MRVEAGPDVEGCSRGDGGEETERCLERGQVLDFLEEETREVLHDLNVFEISWVMCIGCWIGKVLPAAAGSVDEDFEYWWNHVEMTAVGD